MCVENNYEFPIQIQLATNQTSKSVPNLRIKFIANPNSCYSLIQILIRLHRGDEIGTGSTLHHTKQSTSRLKATLTLRPWIAGAAREARRRGTVREGNTALADDCVRPRAAWNRSKWECRLVKGYLNQKKMDQTTVLGRGSKSFSLVVLESK